MDFGAALAALRHGQHVARGGWNGKGMWIALQAGYPDGVPANANTAQALGIDQGATVIIRPYLVMRTVDADYVPWVASQTDLLAEDWQTA